MGEVVDYYAAPWPDFMPPLSKLVDTFLRQTAGRSKGRKLLLLMAGVASAASVAGNRLDNEFLHQITKLRYIRHPTLIALMKNSGLSAS
jgi:hypothetical protein